MKHILPRNVESDFQVQEMFYSRTDKKGVIQDGNAVFARVSEFDRDHLMGQPHNIIRHPDMPRTVFQYFWDILKSGQPVAAYVKNLSASGSYYWVLASVFPIDDGYISIRIKPSAGILPKIIKLYAEILEVEKRDGIADAELLMQERIKGLGFRDYRHFAVEVLTSELNSRRKIIGMKDGTQNLFVSSLNRCQEMFGHLTQILRIKEQIANDAGIISESYKTIKFVGVNMLSEVERLGDNASTIGVVAHTFESWASEVLSAALGTTESVENMAQLIDESSFIIAGSRFQIEMSEFESHVGRDCAALNQFIGYASDALHLVKKNVDKIIDQSGRVEKELYQLDEVLSALHIIRQNGRIEVARLSVEAKEFLGQLDHMKSFIDHVTASSRRLRKDLTELRSELHAIRSRADMSINDFRDNPIESAVG
jgi:PAS domain S-box-containing protein